MSSNFNDCKESLEMQNVAIRLSSLGFVKSLIKEMTNVSEKLIKRSYQAAPGQKRQGNGWLNRKGDEKTNADRILRFLLKAHGSDLSTLDIDDPRLLLQYYETYIATNPAGYVDICRFYYFTLELISNIHPVMKCGSCKKPYITMDARIKDCGICNDIKDRINHMSKYRKRRKSEGMDPKISAKAS